MGEYEFIVLERIQLMIFLPIRRMSYIVHWESLFAFFFLELIEFINEMKI